MTMTALNMWKDIKVGVGQPALILVLVGFNVIYDYENVELESNRISRLVGKDEVVPRYAHRKVVHMTPLYETMEVGWSTDDNDTA